QHAQPWADDSIGHGAIAGWGVRQRPLRSWRRSRAERHLCRREARMIETAQLTLRGWREADKPTFLAMGNDLEVMRYLGPPLSAADVDAVAERQNGFLER